MTHRVEVLSAVIWRTENPGTGARRSSDEVELGGSKPALRNQQYSDNKVGGKAEVCETAEAH